MSQPLSLLSLTPINPAGGVAPNGNIQLISSSRPYYLDTFPTPNFSTLMGSSFVVRNIGASTTSGSTFTFNTLTVNSTLTASTVLLSTTRITGQSTTIFMGGNVGIGTTQPATKLAVTGTMTTSSLQMSNLTAGPSGLASESTNILHLHHNTQGPITTANLGAEFRIDGRNTSTNPLFQWQFRPAGVGTLSTVAVLTSSGRIALGQSLAPSWMVETSDTHHFHANLTRTNAGDLFGVAIQYSFTDTSGNTANYVRTYGGTDGTIATTQAQANGYWAVDCAASSATWPSDATPYASDFVITGSKSWFTTTRVGIATQNPDATLHVNGVIQNNQPSWHAYNDMGATYSTGQTVKYNRSSVMGNVSFNAGGTGAVTINVPGRYHIRFHAFSEAGYGDSMAYFYKTGVATNVRMRTGVGRANDYCPDAEMHAILDLEVGDYIDVRVSQGGLHFNANMYFSGNLIG